jgi:hypothetical protein
MKKETLVKKINTGEVTLKFTKNDGTERVMKCTTCLEKIPSEHHPKGTGPKMVDAVKALSDRINVYDLEACGWRSFNYRNFIEIL